MSVDDYDTDDYYNQDVFPVSRLVYKYAARRFWASFTRGLLLKVNGGEGTTSTSSSSSAVNEQALAVVPTRIDVAFPLSWPSSKKRRRVCRSSSPSVSNSSGNNGFLGDGEDLAASEKGKESSDDSVVLKKPMNALDEEDYSEKGSANKRMRLPDLNEPVGVTTQPEQYYDGAKHDNGQVQEKVNDGQIIAIATPEIQEKKKTLKIRIMKSGVTPQPQPQPQPARIPTRLPARASEQPVNPILPPEYRQMIESMGGKQVQFLVKKDICETDLNRTQNRFPISFVVLGGKQFLTPEEDRGLKEKSLIIHTTAIDTKGVVWPLTLRSWPKFYALATNWVAMAKDNNLKVDDVLHLWCFRIESDLHFAFVKVR